MGTITRIQTVLRLPEELMIRVKYKAKQEKMSLNAYLEMIVTEAVKPSIPKLPKDFKIDPQVEALSGSMPMPTQEQLDADDRLAYILGKGGPRE